MLLNLALKNNIDMDRVLSAYLICGDQLFMLLHVFEGQDLHIPSKRRLNAANAHNIHFIEDDKREFADYEKYDRTTMSTLELLYVGPYSISFVYKLYGTNVNEVKGYSFNYNGDIRKFEENGLKDGILGEAMLNFMSSDLYKNNASQLYANWEPVFKNKAFDTGNWCFDENKIKFFIPAKDLGIESDEIITIDVDNGEDY